MRRRQDDRDGYWEELRPRAVDVGSTGVMYEFLLAVGCHLARAESNDFAFSESRREFRIPKLEGQV